MWLSGSVARASVRRVLGQETCIRSCPGGDRLRPTGATPCPRVEGTGPTRACARGGGSRRRGDPTAGCRSIHSRSGRPGASMEARRCRASCSRARARRHLGSAVCRAPAAHTCASAPARPRTRRPAPQRSPQRCSNWSGTSHGVPGGRRLHVRGNSRRMCRCVAPGGGATRRGRHPCAGSSLG